MADVTKEQIEEALKGYVEPHLEKDLVAAKAVKSIEVTGGLTYARSRAK